MKTIRISKKDINPQDILYLESQGNYTLLHLNDNKKELSSSTLQIFEEKLKGCNFYRVSRSHIVNFSAIEWLSPNSNSTSIILKTGEQFPVSRRRRKFINMIKF
jgi:DNA-binding LytR/AlgR family response regulator